MNTDGIQPHKRNTDDTEKTNFADDGRLGQLKQQMYSRGTQPVTRPRRELSALRKDAQDDWQEEKPPKKKERLLPRSYSLPSIFLVLAILVFVIAAGIAVAFFVSGTNVVTARNIDISIKGPRTLNGGEVIELQVGVRNDNSAALELADLVVRYPEGTRSPLDSNEIMETQRIPLGSIASGDVRNGTVRAALFGRNGEQLEIQVALEYRLSGSGAIFFAESKHIVLMSSGTLDIALDANEQVTSGQNMDITATITSNAKTTIADAIIRVSYPFGFVQKTASPEQEEEGVWSLGDIKPGETRTVRIQGILEGQTGDDRIFRFIAGNRESRDSQMVGVVLAEFEHQVAVVRPFLDLSLVYSDLDAQSFVGRTGEAIPITLRWKNTLDVALRDVVIAATVGGDGLDPYNISVNNGFFRSIDSVILWDKTTTKGELANVPAGAEGTFQIRLVPSATEDLYGTENPTLNFELHAAGQRLSEEGVPETIQASFTDSVKLATDTTLTGRALYFENPLGSVGPLPPRVENETTYGILWEVTNTTNLVRDARVTATLPPYVRWLGTVSPSSEQVTFNENDGTVTWHIGKILPDTGIEDRNIRRVVFSIGLVPSASQVGHVPEIVENQTLVGVDNFTESAVQESFSELTTDLEETDFAHVYGVVVK